MREIMKILLSLTNSENDYQREQAVAAEEAAKSLGAELEIIFADNDSINQSQQLLKAIQSTIERPDAIAFEPVGTALAQVARAAVSAGIGWAVVNGEADYTMTLRSASRVPVFQVSNDQIEVGRIQGRQLRALLPGGGMVLYIPGPTTSTAATQRTIGIQETGPDGVRFRVMKGTWTQESAYAAVNAWLRLSTSHTEHIVAVVAQNDAMAFGARQAFEKGTRGAERERWLNLPFLGCDALLRTGAVWVQRGLLAASVAMPATARSAIEMLIHSLRAGVQPPEQTLLPPKSLPALEQLTPRGGGVPWFPSHVPTALV
jgi:ABC-type sugar transport system substrate-binding protein